MTTDAEFEGFLQRFQPRPPRPLPERGAREAGRWHWYGIGSGLLVAIAVLVWMWSRSTTPSPEPPKPPEPPKVEVRAPKLSPTLGRMRMLASQDPDLLDRALDDDARRLLPDVEGSRGTLGELSKESRS